MWGDDYDLFYTLTPASGSNNQYASNCDVTISGVTWNITGNSTFQPWRLGGKNISNTDRAVYSKTAINESITKVSLKVGAKSSITVNSLTLIVASDASFSSVIESKAVTYVDNSTMDITPSAGKDWNNAYYKFVFNVTNSSNSNGYVQFSEAKFYKTAAPDYAITAATNNSDYGTVNLTGSTITASPKTGYRVVAGDGGYTVTSGTATVVNNGDNTFTVTPTTDCTVQINFEAIPKYTVTFDAEGGSCATTSLTESIGGGGVTLPTATISVAGWEFVGWATSAVSNLSTRPTLYAAGSTYPPTADITLHAVYALEDAINKYAMATSNSDIVNGANVVITSLGNNKFTLANNNGTLTGITNFTPTDGVITCTNTQAIWTLGISSGNVTIANGGKYLKRSTTTVSADDNSYNWTINESSVDDRFLVKDASNNFYLEHDGTSWAAFNTSSPSQNAINNYIGLTIYVEKPNKYDSNPTALVTPSVAFTSNAPVTLYLEGPTTNTNTATVTGSSNPIKYSSSNTAVATVTNAGVVTPVGVGTATITASVDAELGESTSASDTYDVTVKSATTLAGIKAVTTGSETNFTADLASDMVITYISGAHAYLQNGDVAVYASCGNTEGWAVGKKFTGAISGKVKRVNNEYQITAIDQAPVAGGDVPNAIEVAITNLTTANYATYEGRKIAINGATISTAMASDVTSGGKITTDGTNTLNIYAREKGITLTKDEKGNFVGYIGRYNDGIRYYMYEQSQFTKTHNVPQNQDMAFATDSYTFDEGTAAVTSFAGQAVTETTVKGTLTYSIKDGSANIITSLNPSTGAVVLNGARGTATIVATAAYAVETEGGIITPYNELSKEYTITVRPRYTVTFSVNGTETELREESFGAGITVPANPAAIGEYTFQGWSSAIVAMTDTKPDLASLTAGSNYKPSADVTYYAVFAIQTQTGTTDVLDQSYSYSEDNWTVGGTYIDKNSYYLLQEGGYVESDEFDLSIISKVEVLGGTFGGDQYNTLTIGDGTNTWKDVTVTGNSNTGLNPYTDGNALSGIGKLRVTSTCGSGTGNSAKGVRVSGFKIYKLGPVYGYTRYTTAITVDITIPASGYLSYCSPYKLDFSETEVKAYKASVDGSGNVTLDRVDVVPAEEGIVLFSSEAQTANEAKDYTIPVTAEDASDVTGNQMVGVLTRTQVEWNPSDGVYNYILQQGEFRKATTPGGYLKPNRAYLSTSYNVTAQGAKALTIVFNDATTGINGVEEMSPVTKTRKVVKNGRLVIETPNGEFTIDGARVK
jgi:hypothetical protein